MGGCDLLVGAALNSPQAMSSPPLCPNHSSALDMEPKSQFALHKELCSNLKLK